MYTKYQGKELVKERLVYFNGTVVISHLLRSLRGTAEGELEEDSIRLRPRYC